MPLNPKQLADEINKALDVRDKDGKLPPTTTEMELYATAVVTTLQTSLAFFPPNTVTGTANAPGAPVLDLAAMNGTFLPPIIPTTWLTIMVGIGGNPALIVKEATASTLYIQSAAKLTFDQGTLQGVSTATPTSPGNLIAGGTGGYIDGLNGSDWAKQVLFPGADLKTTEKVFNAVSKYIRNNAIITFPPASVIGVFASPGSPLTAGTAVSGIIT